MAAAIGVNNDSLAENKSFADYVYPRNFIDEWKDHCSDASLHLLYRSLEAPYGFVDRVKSVLDATFVSMFSHFLLVPKGSSQSETALKFSCDLDIDVLLPRALLLQTYSNVTPATWGNEVTTLLCRFIALQLYSRGNAAVQLKFAEDEEVKVNKLTRSIPFIVTIDHVDIEVDLFFKFFAQDGTIIGLSREDSNGKRHFTAESLFQRQVPSRKFTVQEVDERKATILFFKLWKFQQLKLVATKSKVVDMVKGYHLNLAMDYIMLSDPVIHPEAGEKLASQGTLTAEVVQFSRENVKQYFLRLLDYLIVAYDPNTSALDSDSKFCFEGGESPFRADSVGRGDEDMGKLLSELSALRTEFNSL